MRSRMPLIVVFTFAAAAFAQKSPPALKYSWLKEGEVRDTIEQRFPPPAESARTSAAKYSFALWLRNLPLKPANTPVLLFDGREKPRQDVHAAVIEIDTGSRDLQQCADSIIRLRAEYLFATGQTDRIAFRFTSGDLASWSRWAAGERPRIGGKKVTWSQTAKPDDSYTNFRAYLDSVFTYAGTISLAHDLTPVATDQIVQTGDVFIHAGSPGHAVIVLDTAENPKTHQRLMLLAQGFMPAQDMHVLKNLVDADLSPWFAFDAKKQLVTPEWIFEPGEMKRFAE